MKSKLLIFIIFIVPISVLAQKVDKSVNVMSYNIRYNNVNDKENAWPNRKDNVKALIKFHDVEILGVQEALNGQINELLLNSNFEVEGVGRDDGDKKGEYSAIFYDKSRFVKRDGGTFWLSTTPNVPSKGWDAALNRICTWLKLYDKLTRKEFMVFNTHYDHVGINARIQSALLIKSKMIEMAANLPVILTGDLNVTPETEAISTIKSFLIDSREVSKEPAYGPIGTFNGFKFDSELKDRIDYVFVNDKFIVQKYANLTDSKDKRYYSDHLPVFVKLNFK
ncbi:endonuclease/exonuclease/phosphatase family protein [Pedobacter flavus]|uniref:Endonuclease/exonuclease/phosphatase family protein n=1 Tax=Pedobacter flavus TaxID=3113906 RepID=A0ABU7H3F8_9SPHI|nr:endonuclease/exonuclease/phosphatase family protein [Pedobacter sp. VNH31]MEE1885121.1 endonuclease/exonuclease/phosphatase family protein [Pedobacter sp. VNH31]